MTATWRHTKCVILYHVFLCHGTTIMITKNTWPESKTNRNLFLFQMFSGCIYLILLYCQLASEESENTTAAQYIGPLCLSVVPNSTAHTLVLAWSVVDSATECVLTFRTYASILCTCAQTLGTLIDKTISSVSSCPWKPFLYYFWKVSNTQ